MAGGASLVAFVMLLLPFFASSDDPQYEACAPSDCGNGPSISYPFWMDVSPDFCGYPGFKITCAYNVTVMTTISGEEYYVRGIDYKSQTFTIASSKLVEEGCPQHGYSLSLHSPILYYTMENRNISFLFNCSRQIPNSLRGPLHCLDRSDYVVNYSFSESELHRYECKEISVVPVLGTPDFEHPSHGLDGLLKAGFGMGWTASACGPCEISGGRCGYNASTQQFICFCANGRRDDICKGGKALVHNLFLSKFLRVGVSDCCF